MALSLSNLHPAAGSKKRKKRVGRGNASGHGTYSTRGLKGQRSRSGGRVGLKMKGLKSRLQKLPKLRGFRSPYSKSAVVNLFSLEEKFTDGSVVDPKALQRVGLLDQGENQVKILGQGKISKKLTIKDCQVSASVREQIEKIGGKVI